MRRRLLYIDAGERVRVELRDGLGGSVKRQLGVRLNGRHLLVAFFHVENAISVSAAVIGSRARPKWERSRLMVMLQRRALSTMLSEMG